METTGVLDMELVDHVFSKCCQQQGLIKEDILNMMEQFGLIVKFATSPTNEMYFVPCQLKSPPDALCEMGPSPSDPCPLYLNFRGVLFLTVSSGSLCHDAPDGALGMDSGSHRDFSMRQRCSS